MGDQVMCLENIFLVDKPETAVRGLQVIQFLPHITISSENNGFKAFRNIRNLNWLKFTDN